MKAAGSAMETTVGLSALLSGERGGRAMLNTRLFRDSYGADLCRECVNDELGIHLRTWHVKYWPNYATCPRCGRENKHIVRGFGFRGKLKVLGRKPRLRP